MQIVVNGNEITVHAGATVAELLEHLGTSDRGIAVAKNDRVVRRAVFASERLREGDRVEIIKAVAGG